MKAILKIFIYLILTVVLLVSGFIIYVQFTWNKVYEAPYPDITASTDSALIAKGRHLVYGPAHCATCHIPTNKAMAIEEGEQLPLMGGWGLEIPPGRFLAPNLTPDTETGIGLLSDGEIARTMRHSVGSDGRFIFPFMPYQNMSDEDLTAIISFLRSQEPVSNKMERPEYSFLGKAILAIGLIKPEAPQATPPKNIKKDSSVVYGKYLANSIANCVGCHTDRDLQTGEFIGPAFSGGMLMPADNFSQGYGFRTPNLTPDAQTGIIANWTEEMFIQRFRTGRITPVSPMPWGAFSRMEEVELKALYRYLKSLDPVSNKIDKTIYAPGEAFPES